MTDIFARRRRDQLILAGLIAMLGTADAAAVTLTNGLKGQGLDSIYGSYAPRGDCALEPRLTIDDSGFTFRALGRTVKQTRVEYALSFMGASYDGITSVFFPFPVNDSDFGRIIMMVNDDEKPGVIRFDADLAPGQRPDPFHAALTGASPFQLCKGSAPAGVTPRQPASPAQQAPVAVTPMEWSTLPSLVGRYPGRYDPTNIDLFDKGAIAAAIRSRLGAKIEVLRTNLSVVTPLQRQGSLYYLSGNAPHQGGIDQAYVLIDANRRAVQIGLWEKGKLTVHAPPGARIPVPADIAKLLDQSPPETAVALPGTPWELVPVQGRAPIAYVSAAASPNIESLSLYCEGGRPYMAMLLTKPSRSPALTMTWNFAGRLVNIPVQRASNTGTQWIGGVTGTPLVLLLMQQKGTVMLRLNGNLEGEASLTSAPAVLRTALRPCLRL